ncbi:putative transcriptional regulator [Paenibacillus cellulosilyticus]|uniref:Putative transcriptional regulator n=1 Tax=Paenibacillus cellulosilyticus TaxID=375489 RepID=A0A2V2Z992_9BACL|nr:BlaI/MecI/CopY family transcriptional regulator [Paenibacillus cellulosilyticus]PWW08681.1 putative transcriptional regulator [Paenibacillus cellulosilyticus]QKS48247.1 BlaI/MecI/CopY family transcriptional regulator [Paenibacillus cellulosilyticus]
MRIKKLNVGGEGLNRFFGPLEAKIMDLLWSSEGMSIKEVQSILNQDNPISINAVTTVMNRLLEKGHLSKVLVGTGRTQAARFSTVQSKEQFLSEQTKAVSQGLIQEYGSLVVSHMIDALEDVDQEMIERLEHKLSEIKKRNKQ